MPDQNPSPVQFVCDKNPHSTPLLYYNYYSTVARTRPRVSRLQAEMNWLFGKKDGKGGSRRGGPAKQELPDELRGGGNPNADSRNALQRGRRQPAKKQSEGKVYGSQHVIPMEAFQDGPGPQPHTHTHTHTQQQTNNNKALSPSTTSATAATPSSSAAPAAAPSMFGGMSLNNSLNASTAQQTPSSSSNSSMFGGMSVSSGSGPWGRAQSPAPAPAPVPAHQQQQGGGGGVTQRWGPAETPQQQSGSPVMGGGGVSSASLAFEANNHEEPEQEEETSAFGFLMGDDDEGAPVVEADDSSGFSFMQQDPLSHTHTQDAPEYERRQQQQTMIDFGGISAHSAAPETVIRQRSGTNKQVEALAQARTKALHAHTIFFSTFSTFSSQVQSTHV
jgi:hypothetical protein